MSERFTISADILVFVGDVSPVYFSLNLRPPRELSLGFGTIKASSWRCSGLLAGVSPVFDCTETILEAIFSHSPGFQSCLWKRFPPESSHSGSVPSRHLFGTVAVYYRGSPQCSIVQKLFWGKSFPHSPGFQSCLRKRFPPESSLSGWVPSRHLLGAVVVYYRGSLQYSIVQKLFWGKSFPHSPGFQSCLWKRFPPESSLSGSVPSRHLLGAVAVYYLGSHQYSIVQKLFWGKHFPHLPGFQSYLWTLPPPRALSRVQYHQGIFLALWPSTTGGLPSIQSYRNCSARQPSRAVSGSASPSRALSRVRYHQGIFLAL